MECSRCQGFMVEEKTHTPVNEKLATYLYFWRCIQCGEQIDSVILLNRLLPLPEPYKKNKKRGARRA